MFKFGEVEARARRCAVLCDCRKEAPGEEEMGAKPSVVPAMANNAA